MAKWCAMTAITLAAVGLGQLGTWYYTSLLFETVPFSWILTSYLVFALWLILINTFVLLLSCLLKSIGGVAFISLASAAVLSVVTSLLGDVMKWSPSRLADEASRILQQGRGSADLWLAVTVASVFIIALVAGAASASKHMWTKA